MTTSGNPPDSGMTTGRLEAFSDGVFAIVITLLVLDLKVPHMVDGAVSRELPHELLDLWPNFLSYAFSFVIVGVYWVGHHAAFSVVRRVDRNLLWLNILFLLCVAFIPFPAALLGEYPAQRIAIVVYGLTQIVTGFALLGLWQYATRGHRLVERGTDPRLIHRYTHRILINPVVYSTAILVSFVRAEAGFAVFLLSPVIWIFPATIDRVSEAVHRPAVGRPPPPVSGEGSKSARR
jgi:uncharacterized membrane protein